MLYISNRYELKLDENIDKKDNVYELKYMEMTKEEGGDVSSNYANEPDDVDIEDFYNNTDINLHNFNRQNENLEKMLLEDYNHQLTLKDINHRLPIERKAEA